MAAKGAAPTSIADLIAMSKADGDHGTRLKSVSKATIVDILSQTPDPDEQGQYSDAISEVDAEHADGGMRAFMINICS